MLCDPDGMLRDVHVVEQALLRLEAESAQPCGVYNSVLGTQFAIAIMRKMALPMTAETFAAALHNQWGVGHEECGNGIVLLIAVENRQMFLSTGKDAKRRIPDAHIQQVLRHMRPYLRSGNIQDAVGYAISRYC